MKTNTQCARSIVDLTALLGQLGIDSCTETYQTFDWETMSFDGRRSNHSSITLIDKIRHGVEANDARQSALRINKEIRVNNNRKKSVMTKYLSALLFLTSCTYQNPSVTLPVPMTDASIASNWVATDPSSRVPTLNFSQLLLNTTSQDIIPIADCLTLLNGQPDEAGTSPAINGAAMNQYSVTGSSTSGLIQFGPLSHADHALTDVCYTIGQEEYSYIVEGSTMTLCDIKYFSCGTYKLQ